MGIFNYFSSKSDKQKLSHIQLLMALLCLLFCSCQNDQSSQTAYESETQANSKVEVDTEMNKTDTEYAEDVVNQRNIYKYQFDISGTTYRITLNLEEETAQLYVEGNFAPNGKTFYGSCRREYRNPQIICSRRFSGADDFNIIIKGEKSYWSSFQYIDTENDFLYTDLKYYEAKKPDYRIKITPIE